MQTSLIVSNEKSNEGDMIYDDLPDVCVSELCYECKHWTPYYNEDRPCNLLYDYPNACYKYLDGVGTCKHFVKR